MAAGSRNIRQVQEAVAFVGDVLLPALEVVPLQELEHVVGGLRVGGHDLDEPPGLRVHGGQPHHVRVVLAQALGAVYLDLLALQLLDDLALLLLGVGEPGLLPAGDLEERGLGDIDVALLDQGGAQAVEHGQNQGADLVAVHVCVGADDHLGPAEIVQIKGAQILYVLALDLHAAAQDLHQVGDDLALEDPGVVRLQAVEDLAPDGHDALKFRVPAQLDAAQGGVALHDINFPAGDVLGPAVHEFLDPVGDVDGAGELLLHVQPGLLRLLPGALVDEDLLGDAQGVVGVLDEVDLQAAFQKLGHGVLDELVGDGLLCLVLVAGLGGEVAAHQHQTVLNIRPGDLALVFLVLVVLPQPGVDGPHESQLGGLFGTAAVLQPAGVVVVLDDRHLVGEAAGDAELHLVLVLVRPVTAPPFGLPVDRVRQGGLSRQLADVVGDAVLIEKFRGVEFSRRGLHPQAEGDARVDHRLALHDAGKILGGDVDVGEYLQIREPAGAGAGLFAGQGGLLELLTLFTHHFALPEVELVLEAVPPDGDVHVVGRILGGAGAQAVEAQGKFIILALVVAVLASGVEFAEDQLPVPAFFLFVPVHRTAPALVLHLHAVVQVAGDGNESAMTLPGLVDGVGEDLKNGVFTALQAVGAEDDPRALSHAVRALQGADRVVAVVRFLFC